MLVFGDRIGSAILTVLQRAGTLFVVTIALLLEVGLAL
jgi:hypothetical protein